MVGHRRQVGHLAVEVVVPARPRAPAARELRAVGVQHRLVAAVRDRAEQVALAVGGIGEDRERLVGVARERNGVELLGLAAARSDQGVRVRAHDPVNRRREA